ncbi:MAG: glycosyltransferase family 2 protein [Hyphomicrobiales bacterium]|nr:glycosyltransferase family 2 protein [Hyphomicrobiales bacterium]
MTSAERIAPNITPMILTFDEAANIARTLDRLRWAKEVLIVDSGSADETLTIAKQYANVRVVGRPFDDAASQCNFGLTQISTRWVLSLDADYVLSEALVAEIEALCEGEAAAYAASFVYCVYGKRLRGSLYPPRTILYRRDSAHYINEGHTQRVKIVGATGALAAPVLHDDRKPLARWFASQNRYAAREAEFLLASDAAGLKTTARLRRLGWPAPILSFFYTLFWKGCLLDGWAGWFYVMQRATAEFMIALAIADKRLARRVENKAEQS